MKNLAVIGAGQLGSRHLQALKALEEPVHIDVMDPSAESLEMSRKRFAEAAGFDHHQIQYHTEIALLKKPYDLVIVATSSDVRRKVLENLFQQTSVRFLVLEKILFDHQEDYSVVQNLFNKHGAQAWVNCCMRQMKFYYRIREQLCGQRFFYTVTQSQIGLATSVIHYVDYMCFLTGNTDFSIQTDLLEPKTIASKRKGFLELLGTLVVDFSGGSRGIFTGLGGNSAFIQSQIHTDSSRIIVWDTENRAEISYADRNWTPEPIAQPFQYQSVMTTDLARMIFEKGTCPLTPFSDSIRIHQNLLEPLRAFLKTHQLEGAGRYPFT